jgi:hypothetical protein
MYEAAANCKDIAWTLVTNWEPHCVMLAGYGYVVRHVIKVQLITPYRVSHLQHYGVMICGNVTSVDPPLALSCPSVHQSARFSAWNNSTPTRQIFMKFDI